MFKESRQKHQIVSNVYAKVSYLCGGILNCRRVVEGGRTPVPPRHAPPRTLLESEAGSNSLNSKLTYIFRFLLFFINRQCHNLSILWLFLKFFLVIRKSEFVAKTQLLYNSKCIFQRTQDTAISQNHLKGIFSYLSHL